MKTASLSLSTNRRWPGRKTLKRRPHGTLPRRRLRRRELPRTWLPVKTALKAAPAKKAVANAPKIVDEWVQSYRTGETKLHSVLNKVRYHSLNGAVFSLLDRERQEWGGKAKCMQYEFFLCLCLLSRFCIRWVLVKGRWMSTAKTFCLCWTIFRLSAITCIRINKFRFSISLYCFLAPFLARSLIRSFPCSFLA